MLAAHAERVGVEIFYVLLDGRSERVVCRNVPALLFVEEHQREFYDPKEIELVGGD